jgi:hypothetical protein
LFNANSPIFQLHHGEKVKKNIQDVEPKVKERSPFTNAEISEFCDKFSNVDLKDGNESREKKGDTSLTQGDSDDDENQIEIIFVSFSFNVGLDTVSISAN